MGSVRGTFLIMTSAKGTLNSLGFCSVSSVNSESPEETQPYFLKLPLIWNPLPMLPSVCKRAARVTFLKGKFHHVSPPLKKYKPWGWNMAQRSLCIL